MTFLTTTRNGEPPNIGLELANPVAAHGVLRPPCLLSGLAVQARVGLVREGQKAHQRRITDSEATSLHQDDSHG